MRQAIEGEDHFIWGEVHWDFFKSLKTKGSMLQVNIWANNETKADRCCLLLQRIMQEVIQGWKEDENEIVLKFRIQNLNNYIVRIWQPSGNVILEIMFQFLNNFTMNMKTLYLAREGWLKGQQMLSTDIHPKDDKTHPCQRCIESKYQEHN